MLDIVLDDRSAAAIHGLYGLDEEKFRQLDAGEIAKLWKSGYLDLLYALMISPAGRSSSSFDSRTSASRSPVPGRVGELRSCDALRVQSGCGVERVRIGRCGIKVIRIDDVLLDPEGVAALGFAQSYCQDPSNLYPGFRAAMPESFSAAFRAWLMPILQRTIDR